MAVLVTGAAGYIGSHAVKRLLDDGHTVVGLDNLTRGHAGAVRNASAGAGDRFTFIKGDTGDRDKMVSVLTEHQIDAVMHFAAYALVGESVDIPLLYYKNNAASAATLIEACLEVGVQRFVFSSTCATYGEPGENYVPIPEDCPKNPISPYGMSKLHVEHMLSDVTEACRRTGKPFGYAALRYFNVAGAHRSGVIGEDHRPETHLIPVVLQACLGQRDHVTVFGTDYPTPDGTCVRDYIHVEDLVDAHVAVMDKLKPGDSLAYNLGIGNGLSVRQIIDSVKRVTGIDFTVQEGERRAGDPPELYANPAKIKAELGWAAKITDIDEIVRTAWAWHQANPDGYTE
ncbi:MAG: UDP-glucose 4-epimerase GalE [Planctomycetota bacterium]